MLIAMAGLPGTGKTTLATLLAARIGAVVLDKDEVRAALFPPEVLDYSSEQDDLCFGALLEAAALLLNRDSGRPVILDGRTFTRRDHVAAVIRAAHTMNAPLAFIVCTCSDTTALRRLEQARIEGTHSAKNRDAGLYWRLKTAAELLDVPHLVVSTERTLDDCTAECLTYLASSLPRIA